MYLLTLHILMVCCVKSEERMVFFVGHPAKYWPPTIVYVVCVYCFVRYLISRPILVTRLLFFISYRRWYYKSQYTPAMPQRPFNLPLCLETYNVQIHSNDFKWSLVITSCSSFYRPRKVGSLCQAKIGSLSQAICGVEPLTVMPEWTCARVGGLTNWASLTTTLILSYLTPTITIWGWPEIDSSQLLNPYLGLPALW